MSNPNSLHGPGMEHMLSYLSQQEAPPLEVAAMVGDLLLAGTNSQLINDKTHKETSLATRYDDKHISTAHSLARGGDVFEDARYVLYTPSPFTEGIGRGVAWQRHDEKPSVFSVVGNETFTHEAAEGADRRLLGILMSSVAYNPDRQAIVTGFNGKDKIITPGVVRKALRTFGFSGDSEAQRK